MIDCRFVFGPKSPTCSEVYSHRTVFEILATVLAGPSAAVGGYFLPGDRWSSNCCAFLPLCRSFGSTPTLSVKTITPSPLDKGEPRSLGTPRLFTPSPVAREVLRARSCRAIPAAATRHSFSTLLWCSAGQSTRSVRPCLGVRRRHQCRWWRGRFALCVAGDVSTSSRLRHAAYAPQQSVVLVKVFDCGSHVP